VLATLLGFAVPASAGIERGDPDRLFVRQYEATSVKQWGKPDRLFKKTPLLVAFDKDHRNHTTHISWVAKCNSYSALVEAGPDLIDVGEPNYTLVECRQRFHRQDDRLAAFFATDPAWRSAKARRLTLSSDDGMTIDLRWRKKR
jgi:hypothetical protein